MATIFDLSKLKRGDFIKLIRLTTNTESIERITEVIERDNGFITLKYKEGGFGTYNSEGKAYKDRNPANPVVHQILDIPQ